MNIFCCIPARGGSKRLPRKNVLPMAGKPMIAYSIEAAQRAEGIEDVYVATEDEEIAGIAEDYGAEVPTLMPEELCGGMKPSHAPCQHLLQHVSEQRGEHYEALLCLQPTSPLRSTEDIARAVHKFEMEDSDFIVSVTPIDPHYFHWGMVEDDEKRWKMYFGDKFKKERPLLPDVFRPNGSVKIARMKALKEVGHFFGDALSVIETPEERSVHVGTQFDFDVCEGLLKK